MAQNSFFFSFFGISFFSSANSSFKFCTSLGIIASYGIGYEALLIGGWSILIGINGFVDEIYDWGV